MRIGFVGNSSEDLPVALRCLDVLLGRRRRHMSDQRLLAFIKRLSTVALQMSSSGTVAVLGVVKKMISVGTCDLLFGSAASG